MCDLYSSIKDFGFLLTVKSNLKDPAFLRAVERDWACTSQLAESLRRDSWGVDIEGSTTPHPFEISKECKILYSNIKGIDNQIDLTSYDGIDLLSPNLVDPLLNS